MATNDDNKLDLPGFTVMPQEPQDPQDPNIEPQDPSLVDDLNDPDPNDGSGNEDEKIGSVIYGMLREEGILSLPDEYEFDGEVASLRNAFEQQNSLYQQQIQEQFLNSVPEQLRDIYEAALGGVSDIDELLSLKRKQTTEIDLSTLDNQRFVIQEDLKQKGVSDAVIKNVLETLEKDGTIETEAKTIDERNRKSAQEQIKQLREQERLERERQENLQKQQIEEFARSVGQNLQTLGWSEDKQRAILKDLFETDQQGLNAIDVKLHSIFQNPQALIAFTDFLQYYDPKKGFDLENYKKVDSKEARKIKNNWEEKLLNTVQKHSGKQDAPDKLDLSRISVLPRN